jgi:hypothetical protein
MSRHLDEIAAPKRITHAEQQRCEKILGNIERQSR